MQAPRVGRHDDIVRRIQGEFLEMPGLRLTEPQARRLWALEPSLCSAVLTELIDDGFLLRTPEGAFVRVDATWLLSQLAWIVDELSHATQHVEVRVRALCQNPS